MHRKLKIPFIVIGLTFVFNLTYAQKKNTNEILERFLQINSDSTVILEYVHSNLHPPELSIISKKGDTINAYTYRAPSKDNRLILPYSISREMYIKNSVSIYKAPIEVNQFFLPQFIEKDEITIFWNDILALDPWKIKDDLIDGDGCPISKNNQIYDGGNIVLTLITKDSIKKLNFYAPAFYEKLCPGREGRIRIGKIENIFFSYFPPLKGRL